MGSFIAEGKKPKPEMKREPSSVPPPWMPGFGAASAASSPPSQGTSSESDDDDDDDDDTGSPAMNLSGNLGAYNNNSSHHSQTMPSYSSVGGWSNSGNHQPRHDSDIRMMPH